MGYFFLLTNGVFAIALITGISEATPVSLYHTVLSSVFTTQSTYADPNPPGPTPAPPTDPSPGPTDPTPQPTEPIPGPEPPAPMPQPPHPRPSPNRAAPS